MSGVNILSGGVGPTLQSGVIAGIPLVGVLIIAVLAITVVVLAILYNRSRQQLSFIDNQLKEVASWTDGIEQAAYSEPAERAKAFRDRAYEHGLRVTTGDDVTPTTPEEGGQNTLATILNNSDDEDFVPSPENQEAKKLHRQLKRSLQSSSRGKQKLATQLETTYDHIAAFDELSDAQQELARDLPADVSSPDELEEVRDDIRQAGIDVETTPSGEAFGSVLFWVAGIVDDYAKLRREHTTQQQNIKRINDLLYPDQATEADLNQLEMDIQANRIGYPAAYQAANDYNLDRIRSPTGRELVTTLAESDASEDAVIDALDSTIDDLNDYTTLSGQLSSTSSVSELESRIDDALATSEEIEGYIGDILAKRLRADRDGLDEGVSLLHRRGTEARVTVLEDVLNDFVGRSTGEVADVEEQRRQVAADLEKYRSEYFESNQYNQYSTIIPNHFTNLVDSLLSEAAQAIENGDRDRGAGLTNAAKLTLDRIRAMYGNRRIQRQLTDLQKLRSSQYQLVTTE